MRIRDYKRQAGILELLHEKRKLPVETIAGEFNVSLVTARRDLAILEKEGKLLRTFGGARVKAEPSLVVKTFGEKQEAMQAAKIKMAKAAADMVKPGMRLMLDSGTTIWAVSCQLKKLAPLTIITTSLAVIEEIGVVEGITIFCTGGKFRPANLDFYGPRAQSALAQFVADIAFMGVDKLIPGRGGYAADQESAAIIRAMGQHADKRVVVADHSKINSGGFVLALESKNIDLVVTDAGISAGQHRQLIKEHYKLIVAK